MSIIGIHFAVAGDGVTGTKPYPFFADALTGQVKRQDYWQGEPERVVGFTVDPDSERVDVEWWELELLNLDAVSGMYVVTEGKEYGCWLNPVQYLSRQEDES